MRTIAIIALLVSRPALAQPLGDSTKDAPAPCQSMVQRFEIRKAWWETSKNWAELRPAPAAAELQWHLPLQVAQSLHGPSYYLVTHSNTQRCYVVVCAGTANICRFFQEPNEAESPNK